MDLFRWVPLVAVLPTFAFLAYWLWRHTRANGTGRLPRTPKEMRQVDPQFADDFAKAGRRLRWFNLWLMLAIVGAAIISSILSRK